MTGSAITLVGVIIMFTGSAEKMYLVCVVPGLALIVFGAVWETVAAHAGRRGNKHLPDGTKGEQ